MSSISPSKSAITIYECTCIICMEVFVEPIELPCKHELCRPCFDELRRSTLSKFECPQCRLALADWFAAKRLYSSLGLVNQKRWLLIKQTFPDEVDMRLNGRSAEIVAESIKNYNQYGIVDSVYASVMSDFDLNIILKEKAEHRETTTSSPTTTTSPTRNQDTFDIHEFLRKEKEDEEKASMEAITKLLKEENNLSVDDYIDHYERRSFVPTPKKARKTPQKRPRTPAPRTLSAVRRKATPEIVKEVKSTPQSPVTPKTPTRSPNLDTIINAVATGQIGSNGGATTSTTRVSTNDIVVTSRVTTSRKRKLTESTEPSRSIEEISTGPLSSSSNHTSTERLITALLEYNESVQKRVKVTSSASLL